MFPVLILMYTCPFKYVYSQVLRLVLKYCIRPCTVRRRWWTLSIQSLEADCMCVCMSRCLCGTQHAVLGTQCSILWRPTHTHTRARGEKETYSDGYLIDLWSPTINPYKMVCLSILETDIQTPSLLRHIWFCCIIQQKDLSQNTMYLSVYFYSSRKHKSTLWQSHRADWTVRPQWYWTLP